MFDYTSLFVSFKTEILPEYIDIMGHMNVMYYIHIFDKATRSFFSSFGLSEDYVRATNMGSFALEQHIRYLAEVRQGQQITVYTRALGRSSKTIHFIHFMVRDQDDALAATSELVGAHANLDERRAAPFPPAFAAGIDQYLANHTKLDWETPVCGTMGVKRK
ncbi:MAG: thioesterase family protein [Chloroflexota bacterium]